MADSVNVYELMNGTDEYSEISGLLHGSYLASAFTSKWMPAKIQIIQNTKLEEEYKEKKQSMLLSLSGDDLEESYGFVVETSLPRLDMIPHIGLTARDSEYNVLGYNRMGVYLCRHADICLEHALITHPTEEVIQLIICRYVPGRRTTAIPRVSPRLAASAEFIEPTKGFDSHVSFLPATTRDALQNQFDRSQVYLYETREPLQPSTRPRQVLPYAIVSYTPGGEYKETVDAKATTDDKLASNPRLRQIVEAINSKPRLIGEEGLLGQFGTVMSVNDTIGSGSTDSNMFIPSVTNGIQSGLSPRFPSVDITGKSSGPGFYTTRSPSPERGGTQPETLESVVSRINARLNAEDQGGRMGGHPAMGRGTGGLAQASSASPGLTPYTASGQSGGMMHGQHQPVIPRARHIPSLPQYMDTFRLPSTQPTRYSWNTNI